MKKYINFKKIPYSITNSKFITKIYFDWIYKKIIEVGNLDRDIIAIDYGCGFGHLKKLNMHLNNKSKIINKILSILTLNFKFYKNVITKPNTEMKIIENHCNLIQQKNLLLSNLIKAKFK